jgi:putative transposase
LSRSGYYRWLKRKPSQRQLDNQRLDAEIREIYDGSKSKGRYGSPKITQELRDRGRKVGKNPVARRMRKAGLRSKVRRKYRVTTDSKHNFPMAPNLLERNFSAPAPDKVWVSDITYLATRAGWLYLTVIIDLFSRMVVGWALSSSLSHEMVVVALKRAIRRRRPAKGLVFHSDRGLQYACGDFREELNKYEFIQSMSRKRDCWDNAVAESFFGFMKTELAYHQRYEGHQDTLRSIYEYIEVFYNRQRRHSIFEYLCSAEYEKRNLKLALDRVYFFGEKPLVIFVNAISRAARCAPCLPNLQP